MADREIDLLPAAEQITLEDLFLLKQGGVSKKLTGQKLIAFLTALADGHGGIHTIEKTGTEGLVDTYRITLADGSTFGYTVTNGEKGDKGDNAYTWIKYASQEPTADSSSMGDIPDKWMGIYAGPLAAPPEDWAAYKWFEIKGQKGDTGAPATVVSSSVTYQIGTSAAEIPTGEWLPAIPETPQGAFLWSRMVHQFNTGEPVTVYSVSRMGLDGLGTLRTVNGIEPDENGNINLTAANVGALAKTGDSFQGLMNANGHRLTGLPSPTDDTDAVPYSLVKDLETLAWSNVAYTSEFAGQTISLQRQNVSYMVFAFFAGTTDQTLIVTGELPVPASGSTVDAMVYHPVTMTGNYTVMAHRKVRATGYSNAVRIVFDAAYVGAAQDNSYLIPMDITYVRKVT